MLVVGDVLDAFYLGSFLFGLLVAAISLVIGSGHGGHALPRLGPGHGGHHAPAHHALLPREAVSPLNLSSTLAFVAWFGVVGYLARHALGALAPVSVAVGVAGGAVAGSLVSRFLSLMLTAGDRTLDPDDYRLPGTIARVTSPIRAGGTGEIVYEQAGVRQVSAARAGNRRAIARGAEVVVARVERGIALVQPWDAFVGDRHADAGTEWT